jgi:hypothetical protein
MLIPWHYDDNVMDDVTCATSQNAMPARRPHYNIKSSGASMTFGHARLYTQHNVSNKVRKDIEKEFAGKTRRLLRSCCLPI